MWLVQGANDTCTNYMCMYNNNNENTVNILNTHYNEKFH